MRVRFLDVALAVQEKFEQAKTVCPKALRKVLFAYKSDKLPDLNNDEIEALLDCEVLLQDVRSGRQVTVFNADMEELFWRTMPSTLQLIPFENMAVSWPDRSNWPWSLRVPSSRKSGPISNRRPLLDTGSVVGMFSRPNEGQSEDDELDQEFVGSAKPSLFYESN